MEMKTVFMHFMIVNNIEHEVIVQLFQPDKDCFYTFLYCFHTFTRQHRPLAYNTGISTNVVSNSNQMYNMSAKEKSP